MNSASQTSSASSPSALNSKTQVGDRVLIGHVAGSPVFGTVESITDSFFFGGTFFKIRGDDGRILNVMKV